MKILLFLSCLVLVQGNPFSALISSMRCFEKCNMSFPTHTTTKVVELDACHRGCRFYSFGTILRPMAMESLNDMCKEDCSASYQPGKNAHFGCVSGCDSADLLLKESRLQEQAIENEKQSMTPLYQIKEIVSRVFGNKQVMKTSVTTFMATDDNTIIAVKEPTHLSFRVIPQENKFAPEVEEEQKEMQDISESNDDVHIMKLSMSNHKSPVAFFSTLFLIGFCSGAFLYLVFFVISSKSPKKVVTKPGSNMPQIVPVKLVRPEDLTKLSIIDDDDMAGPLPPKIKLPDTHI